MTTNTGKALRPPSDPRSTVPMPWRWLLPTLVSSYVYFAVALGLAITCLSVTGASPLSLLLTGIVFGFGVLGLLASVYAFRVSATARALPVAQYVLRETPPFIARLVEHPARYALLAGGVFPVLLVLPGVAALLVQGDREATVARIVLGITSAVCLTASLAGLHFSHEMLSKYKGVLSRELVQLRVENAADAVYYHGLHSLSLGRPRQGVEVRGVFEAGPADLVGARYFKKRSSSLVGIVVVDEKVAYMVFDEDQPLVAELNDPAKFHALFLHIWQNAEEKPAHISEGTDS